MAVSVPDVPRAELQAALRHQIVELDPRHHDTEALRFIGTAADASFMDSIDSCVDNETLAQVTQALGLCLGIVEPN